MPGPSAWRVSTGPLFGAGVAGTGLGTGHLRDPGALPNDLLRVIHVESQFGRSGIDQGPEQH